jgi:hypothetical protein
MTDCLQMQRLLRHLVGPLIHIKLQDLFRPVKGLRAETGGGIKCCHECHAVEVKAGTLGPER